MTCSVDGCESKRVALGYCVAHYKRFKRWGDPNIKRPTKTPDERFWSRVDMSRDCWLWTAGKTKQGYGGFHPRKGLLVLAHRWAYEALVGPIPEGLVIDHLCRVRSCVNPLHLEPVTNIENLRRGAGYALQNGMRTACINGHEYTEENTYRTKDGGVTCRECRREYDRQPHRNAALRRRLKKEAS